MDHESTPIPELNVQLQHRLDPFRDTQASTSSCSLMARPATKWLHFNPDAVNLQPGGCT